MNTVQPVFNKPVVSVILPVYNGGSYLIESVESVLSQEMKDFEFLVIDDCSTDNSYDYLVNLHDSRVTVYKNEKNRGLFYDLNFLIQKSNSSLIKLWAQDDIMYPNCLEAFVSFFNNFPAIGFCYSGRTIIDENGTIKENNKIDNTPAIISTELHAKIAYFTGSIAGNIANVCISKKALETVGLFNEEMKISADFDMWVRLAKDHDTGFIREHLIKLRDHQGQLSRNETYYLNHVKEDLQVYRYLDSYVPHDLKLEGKKIMRNHKLVFYYTLMIKALSKRNVKTFLAFFKELAAFDSFSLMTIHFLKSKLQRNSKAGPSRNK